MLARLASVAVGLWVMMSPGVLELSGEERTMAHILGPLIVAFAVISISEVTRPVRWAVIVPGAALAILPWLLGLDHATALMYAACGIAASLLALIRGAVHGSYGGGWSALVRDGETTDST